MNHHVTRAAVSAERCGVEAAAGNPFPPLIRMINCSLRLIIPVLIGTPPSAFPVRSLNSVLDSGHKVMEDRQKDAQKNVALITGQIKKL